MDERIWVKVVEVGEDERGPRIGCSLKLVSQSDGRDLVRPWLWRPIRNGAIRRCTVLGSLTRFAKPLLAM